MVKYIHHSPLTIHYLTNSVYSLSKSDALQLPHLKIYNKQDILSVTRIRRFETKIGERVQVLHHNGDLEASIRQSSAPFVLVGIPEDIGVLANQGIGGCD